MALFYPPGKLEVFVAGEAMDTHRSMPGRRPPTQAARVEAAKLPRSPESPPRRPGRPGGPGSEPWSPPEMLLRTVKKKWLVDFQTIGKFHESWGAYPGLSSWLIGAYPTKGNKVEITVHMVVANDPKNMKFIRGENHLI